MTVCRHAEAFGGLRGLCGLGVITRASSLCPRIPDDFLCTEFFGSESCIGSIDTRRTRFLDLSGDRHHAAPRHANDIFDNLFD